MVGVCVYIYIYIRIYLLMYVLVIMHLGVYSLMNIYMP